MLKYAAPLLSLLLGAPHLAHAQSYPAKSIRVVVGFQAGGGVDMSARAIGKYLTDAVNQPIVVDNKPGAAGNIAANLVANATPDGYTLLMSNSTIAIRSLFVNLPFDVRKDFDPVSLVAIGPSVLAVNPALAAANVTELIILAKAKPRQLIYGSGGVGNITHLEMELLQVMTGVQMIHVPYKGSAPSVIGLMGGEVVKIMRVPDIRERFASDGFEPAGQPPAEFAKFLREEIAKWARVVKTAGIKPE